MLIENSMLRRWLTATLRWLALWLMRWRNSGLASPTVYAGARHTHPGSTLIRGQKKPEWVDRHLVLLKAHMPDAGCRALAITFNRVFAHREVSVSKSFVHRLLRQNARAVWLARKAIRNASPIVVPVNHCWGVDLTGRKDDSGTVHTILGMLDHGSRRVLALHSVARKSCWHLLGYLCLAIAEFGKPGSIRTDNEACFSGRVFSAGLKLLGIRHQRIDLHCPWQNGRIERFFGTLKQHLLHWRFDGRRALDASLVGFARWYNEVRPHQNLDGRTPLEAWERVDPFHAPAAPKDISFVQAWDGLLCGFHIRR